MNTYKNTIKLLIQTMNVSIPYALLLLAENVFLFRLLQSFVQADPSQAQSIYFISDLNYLCVMGFLFFVFITYEFMRKSRSAGIDETLRERAWIIEWNQFLVLGTMVFLYVVIFLIYIVIAYTVLGMSPICISELRKVLLVNVFLVSLASVGMGYLISRIRNRFIGYFIILFGLFLTLPSTTTYLLKWQLWYHIPVFSLRDWIYILPPDISAFADPLYGVPIENYRIATMFIWIGAAVYLFARNVWKYKKKNIFISSATLAVWLILCCVGIVNKGSILLMGEHPDSAAIEISDYYSENHLEEKVDFQVSDYEMKLHFGQELSAVLKATIEQGDSLQQYVFTLYHGYRIKSVEDANGETLNYEQNGDQVIVENSDQRDCSSITMSYKGNCSMFYSNSNACFLPGFFPYYPKAGAKNVYTDMEFTCLDNIVSHFKVSVTGLKVTSNLPTVENGFEGGSSDIILIGGRYEENKLDGAIQVTYPLLGVSRTMASTIQSDEFQQAWDDMIEFYGLADSADVSLPDKGKMVVVIPSSTLYNGLCGYYEFKDYILVGSALSVQEVLEKQIIAKGKEELKKVFFGLYLDESTDVTEMERYSDEWEQSELTEAEKLHRTFVEKIKEYGVQPVARDVIKYLMDDSDTTAPKDFLESLQIETEGN